MSEPPTRSATVFVALGAGVGTVALLGGLMFPQMLVHVFIGAVAVGGLFTIQYVVWKRWLGPLLSQDSEIEDGG